jgi:hypothetical protein
VIDWLTATDWLLGALVGALLGALLGAVVFAAVLQIDTRTVSSSLWSPLLLNHSCAVAPLEAM